MLTSSEMRTLREAYVSSYEDTDPPSIPVLCREHQHEDEAVIKQVRRTAAKENWEGHRNKRRVKMNTAIERHEDAMIERVAKDLVKKREQFLKEAIVEVDNLLPSMVTELKARVESGFIDDKALVAAIKLMMESRHKIIEQINKELEPTRVVEKGNGHTDTKLMHDLGLFGRVLDVIEGIVDAKHLEGGNYAEVSEKDHRVHQALNVLDAEVVGEE